MMNNIIYYLKPEGKLCINHMYKENLESVWYFNIHEKAAIKHFSRFPPRDLLKKVFRDRWCVILLICSGSLLWLNLAVALPVMETYALHFQTKAYRT